MKDIERFLKKYHFEQKQHVVENSHIDGSSNEYFVQDKYINPMENKIIWVHYDLEDLEDGETSITNLLIIVEYDDLRLKFETLLELEEFFTTRKLLKRIGICRQRQNVKFAKDEFKLALRNIRFSIIDYTVAKFRIIKIKLGGKFK